MAMLLSTIVVPSSTKLIIFNNNTQERALPTFRHFSVKKFNPFSLVSNSDTSIPFSFFSRYPFAFICALNLDTSKRFEKMSSFIAFAVNGDSTHAKATHRRGGTRNRLLSEGRDEDEARGPHFPWLWSLHAR